MYRPNQIDDADLAYYYTPQPTSQGVYYRLKTAKEHFPAGFYASERLWSYASVFCPNHKVRGIASQSAASQQPALKAVDSPSNIDIGIAVCVGEPLDYREYRHTAICLRPDNGTPTMIVHITGPNMEYQFEAKDDCSPDQITGFTEEVLVGRVRTPMTKSQLENFINQTPIDNSSYEFNCQSWVGDVLQRLASAGYISQKDCDSGVDGMVNAIMKAKDEPT